MVAVITPVVVLVGISGTEYGALILCNLVSAMLSCSIINWLVHAASKKCEVDNLRKIDFVLMWISCGTLGYAVTISMVEMFNVYCRLSECYVSLGVQSLTALVNSIIFYKNMNDSNIDKELKL